MFSLPRHFCSLNGYLFMELKHMNVWSHNKVQINVSRYCDMYATNKTGSSSDDCIYYQLVTHSLIITLKHRQYSAMSSLHQLQFTFAHALGFSCSTSRLLATDADAQTVNSLTLRIFHVNLLVTETDFSTHADNSLRTGCELTCTKLADLYSTRTVHTLLVLELHRLRSLL
jgi:hypothetical protein